MEDYATLNLAKNDVELNNQMASGYFAVLSGKVFELREMEQGDDKVCLCHFELSFWLTSLGFITRSPPTGEDARCLSRRNLLRGSRLGES
jgi:hypothetical protein